MTKHIRSWIPGIIIAATIAGATGPAVVTLTSVRPAVSAVVAGGDRNTPWG